MSGCAARSCIDIYDPVKVRRLKEWTESDAKFLRKLSRMTNEENHHQENSALLSAGSYSCNINISTKRSGSLHERFAGRQRFLRSYTFSQDKEKLPIRFLRMIKHFWIKMKKMRKRKKNSNRDSSCSLWKGCVKFLFSCAAKGDDPSEECIWIKMKKMCKGKKNRGHSIRDSSCSLWKGCMKFLLSCAAKGDDPSEECISITRKS